MRDRRLVLLPGSLGSLYVLRIFECLDCAAEERNVNDGGNVPPPARDGHRLGTDGVEQFGPVLARFVGRNRPHGSIVIFVRFVS